MLYYAGIHLRGIFSLRLFRATIYCPGVFIMVCIYLDAFGFYVVIYARFANLKWRRLHHSSKGNKCAGLRFASALCDSHLNQFSLVVLRHIIIVLISLSSMTETYV